MASSSSGDPDAPQLQESKVIFHGALFAAGDPLADGRGIGDGSCILIDIIIVVEMRDGSPSVTAVRERLNRVAATLLIKLRPQVAKRLGIQSSAAFNRLVHGVLKFGI